MNNSIARYLAANDMSQQELAQLLNVSQATISDWASGTKKPRDEYIYPLARIMKRNAVDLIAELRLSKNNAEA